MGLLDKIFKSLCASFAKLGLICNWPWAALVVDSRALYQIQLCVPSKIVLISLFHTFTSLPPILMYTYSTQYERYKNKFRSSAFRTELKHEELSGITL